MLIKSQLYCLLILRSRNELERRSEWATPKLNRPREPMHHLLHQMLGWLILLSFPALIVGMWPLIAYKISQHGWRDFAQLYRLDKLPQGRRFRWQSGSFNMQGSYARIINVVIAPEGIGLSVSLLFRCGHSSLLVPWPNVTAVEEKGFTFLFKYLRITMTGGGRTFRLRLPMWAKGEVLKYKPMTS